MAVAVPLITLAVTAATTAYAASASASAARKQNRAIRASQASARFGTAATLDQLSTQAGYDMQKRRNEAEQVVGRIRATAAEVGSDNGSFLALQRQAAYDEQISDEVTRRNYDANVRRVQSGLDAQLIDLGSRIRNPVLDAFTGGIGGLQTGLSIGGTIGQFGQYLGNQNPALGGQTRTVT